MIGERKTASAIVHPRKRRKLTSAIEEIAFDFNAREDYLTGFHKRKLQRIKHAKEEATKKEREERITARKIIRDGRKSDLEKHVETVNSMLRDGDGELLKLKEENGTAEEDQWDGIAEVQEIDHEAEYIDEDRFTTVTVEAVEVSKDGLHRMAEDAEDDEETNEDSGVREADKRISSTSVSNNKAKMGNKKRVWAKERPIGPKKKKKKFKYESKADRKVTRHKEKSKSKAKAKARRE